MKKRYLTEMSWISQFEQEISPKLFSNPNINMAQLFNKMIKLGLITDVSITRMQSISPDTIGGAHITPERILGLYVPSSFEYDHPIKQYPNLKDNIRHELNHERQLDKLSKLSDQDINKYKLHSILGHEYVTPDDNLLSVTHIQYLLQPIERANTAMDIAYAMSYLKMTPQDFVDLVNVCSMNYDAIQGNRDKLAVATSHMFLKGHIKPSDIEFNRQRSYIIEVAAMATSLGYFKYLSRTILNHIDKNTQMTPIDRLKITNKFNQLRARYKAFIRYLAKAYKLQQRYS